MEARHRYASLDAYTLEELRREYLNSDNKGRIRLLEELSEAHLLSADIEQLVYCPESSRC